MPASSTTLPCSCFFAPDHFAIVTIRNGETDRKIRQLKWAAPAEKLPHQRNIKFCRKEPCCLLIHKFISINSSMNSRKEENLYNSKNQITGPFSVSILLSFSFYKELLYKFVLLFFTVQLHKLTLSNVKMPLCRCLKCLDKCTLPNPFAQLRLQKKNQDPNLHKITILRL